MAVKPITNKQVVASSNINRAEQVSTKDTKIKSGNVARSIVPGNNYDQNYAITLKDIDSSVLGYVKNVIKAKPTVKLNDAVAVALPGINPNKFNVTIKKKKVRIRGKNFLPCFFPILGYTTSSLIYMTKTFKKFRTWSI